MFRASCCRFPPGAATTPRSYVRGHIGGFWVLQAAAPDEALAWGARPPSLSGVGRGASVSDGALIEASVLDAAQIEAIISRLCKTESFTLHLAEKRAICCSSRREVRFCRSAAERRSNSARTVSRPEGLVWSRRTCRESAPITCRPSHHRRARATVY